MASITITRNKTLPDTSQKSDFHDLVDLATAAISNIEGADISNIAVANKVSGISLYNLTSVASGSSFPQSALEPISISNKVSGSSLFNLSSLVSTSGLIPYFNIASSLASGGTVIYDGVSNFVGAGFSNVSADLINKALTDSAGTTSITGLGFRPKVIYFWASQSGNGAVGRSFGFSDSTNNHEYHFDNVGNQQGSDSYCLQYDDSTNDYQLVANNFTADGFDMVFTKTGSPSGTWRIFYIALG